MIDHVSLYVPDLAAARAFYAAALAPLGYVVKAEYPEAVGLGAGEGMADLWLGPKEDVRPQHLAFTAPSRAAVDAFHAAALAAGGRDNGPPGLRDYTPTYYAAFVYDQAGHNIEAVCHADPAARARKPSGARRASRKRAKPSGKRGAARARPAKARRPRRR